MPANDGNQTSGSPTNIGSGGLTTAGPVNAGTLEAGNALANQSTLSGAAIGSPVLIQAQGSDANIGIQLVPKGTGVVKVPALDATGTVNLTGAGVLASGDP